MALTANATTNSTCKVEADLSPRISNNPSQKSFLTESPTRSDAEIGSQTAREDGPARRSVRQRHGKKQRKHDEPREWKKILWVKQSYPDNYTDPPTFLSHLQWNSQVVPYDFWPLVADSTVIVQHICSVVIFICCFIGIYQERVSPVSIVGWGSSITFVCWLLWDIWTGIGERRRKAAKDGRKFAQTIEKDPQEPSSNVSSFHDETRDSRSMLTVPTTHGSRPSSRTPSPNPSILSLADPPQTNTPAQSNQPYIPPFDDNDSLLSSHWQSRLSTAKSAILIYSALLALSPILKSLTKSTTSDSIWALSAWLLLINVFFFDYSGTNSSEISDITNSSSTTTTTTTTTTGVIKYQSSLSTNAALMASTVLASRLTSTTHVFSLTLFSIEVFGLFPVFRRHLRSWSWKIHVILTILLVITAGAGLGLILTDAREHDDDAFSSAKKWRSALAGAVTWSVGNILAMGGCSWWLISLQKYKNVVIGPWDAAKPVVRKGGG